MERRKGGHSSGCTCGTEEVIQGLYLRNKVAKHWARRPDDAKGSRTHIYPLNSILHRVHFQQMKDVCVATSIVLRVTRFKDISIHRAQFFLFLMFTLINHPKLQHHDDDHLARKGGRSRGKNIGCNLCAKL